MIDMPAINQKPLFDYKKIFAHKKQFFNVGGLYKTVPQSMDHVIRKLREKCNGNMDDPHVILRAASDTWDRWDQVIQKFASFINVCDDEKVLRKLNINPDPNQLKIMWQILNDASVGKKVQITQKTITDRKFEIQDLEWSISEYDNYCKNAVKKAHALCDQAYMSNDEKNNFIECLVVVMYRYSKNLRAIQNTIVTSRHGANHVVCPKSLDGVPLKMYINYYEHKNAHHGTGPVVHEFCPIADKDLYRFLNKAIELSKKHPEQELIIYNYVKTRSYSTKQFRELVLKAHGTVIGTRMLRILQITRNHQGAMPSYEELAKLAADCGHNMKRDLQYIQLLESKDKASKKKIPEKEEKDEEDVEKKEEEDEESGNTNERTVRPLVNYDSSSSDEDFF